MKYINSLNYEAVFSKELRVDQLDLHFKGSVGSSALSKWGEASSILKVQNSFYPMDTGL